MALCFFVFKWFLVHLELTSYGPLQVYKLFFLKASKMCKHVVGGKSKLKAIQL